MKMPWRALFLVSGTMIPATRCHRQIIGFCWGLLQQKSELRGQDSTSARIVGVSACPCGMAYGMGLVGARTRQGCTPPVLSLEANSHIICIVHSHVNESLYLKLKQISLTSFGPCAGRHRLKDRFADVNLRTAMSKREWSRAYPSCAHSPGLLSHKFTQAFRSACPHFQLVQY